MVGTDHFPTAPARIGTMTRKPLPKIEASGVLVASMSLLITKLLPVGVFQHPVLGPGRSAAARWPPLLDDSARRENGTTSPPSQ